MNISYSSNLPSNQAHTLLSSIPMAIAAPILEYQKINAQKRLLTLTIEAKRQERVEILKTMQTLAQHGDLTPEIASRLMDAYYLD